MSTPMDWLLAFDTIEEQVRHAREVSRTMKGAKALTADPRFNQWLVENKDAILALRDKEVDTEACLIRFMADHERSHALHVERRKLIDELRAMREAWRE
jgi:hypothetical protein